MSRRAKKLLGDAPPPGLRVTRFGDGPQAPVVFSFPVEESPHELPESLTQAERAVAHRLLAGDRTDAIAAGRGVSRSTVAKQIEAIYRKLRVGSRAQLAARLNQSRRRR